MPFTIDNRVLSPRNMYYNIKVISSYCDTMTIDDTSYRYELIGSQLSTNRFMSLRASESALSITHWVQSGLTIVAND
jgi:hypothetical protein